jgi:hypothetical protein
VRGIKTLAPELFYAPPFMQPQIDITSSDPPTQSLDVGFFSLKLGGWPSFRRAMAPSENVQQRLLRGPLRVRSGATAHAAPTGSD